MSKGGSEENVLILNLNRERKFHLVSDINIPNEYNAAAIPNQNNQLD